VTATSETAADYRDIPLGLIDEPDLPTRSAMPPQLLDSLARSIAAHGLLQAIGVEQRGPRFSIIYGHRRFVAHKMLSKSAIHARVYREGTDHKIAMQEAENADREEVNIVDQGEWLLDLYENHCGKDLDKLCALVGKSFRYVDELIRLALGDDKVKQALRDGKISKGVAEQLNRIDADDLRDYYLQNAVEHGMSVRGAKFARMQADQIIASRQAAPIDETPAEPSNEVSYAVEHRCVVCGGTHDVTEMAYIQVHRYCQKARLEPWLQRQRDANG
jgi:ParB/RepB/Spo0J family partition protein